LSRFTKFAGVRDFWALSFGR